MSINLSALMKQRYDTAANWTAQNPTLLAGEIGIESDTKKWKVGTGSIAWASLVYAIGGTYPIVNADIAAGAEIAVSKLADGSARQLLQTDAAGTGVEWTSNVSIPGVLSVTAGTAALPGIAVSGDANTGIYSPGADQVGISTGGMGRVLVDGSGNVGLGATPSAWQSTWKAIEFSNSNSIGSTGAQIALSNNAYNTAAGWLYKTTAAAGLYQVNTGQHIWYTAPSGTAGAAISFTQAMTLDASGKLLLGTTQNGGTADFTLGIAESTAGTKSIGLATDAGREQCRIDFIKDAASTTRSGSVVVTTYIGNLAYESLRVAAGGTTTLTALASTAPFVAKIGSTEVTRIDSSGRLLVGTSSASTNFFNTTITSNIFQIDRAGAGDSAGISITSRNTGAGVPFLVFARSNAATAGTNTLVTSGQNCGLISFQGNDGTEFVEAAAITCEVDGTPGANDMPGRLVFSTTPDGAATPTERLRITNDGVMCHDQPAPATYAAAATLTVADLKTGIITYTGGAATLTLPTGTLTEGGFAGIYTNMTFEWSVINTGAGICTIGAGAAHTIVGSGSVAVGASARFTSRRTAANTFVSYRLS